MNNSRHCYRCGKEGKFKKVDTVDCGTIELCPTCRKNNLRPCNDCENITLHATQVPVGDGYKYYCDDCVDNNSFYCDNCDTRYEGDDYRYIGNDRYCRDCFDSDTFGCNGCGEYSNVNDALYCEGCGSDYCESCYSDHGCDNEDNENNEDRLPEPSHSTKYQFHKGKSKGQYLTSKRFVGIELEAENGSLDKIDFKEFKKLGITACRDGSLNQSGIEIQTPPANLDQAEKVIKYASKALTEAGFEATKSCGLHIHLDARELKKHPTKLIRAFKTYYIVEDIIFAMLPSSRSNNHYCQTLADGYTYSSFKDKKMFKQNEAASFWYKREIKNKRDIPATSRYEGTRYSGLNFHSVYYRGSIEIRYHSGTLNPIKILNWIVFNQALIDYAENHFNDKEIEKLSKMTDLNKKIDYLAKIAGLTPDMVEYIKARIGNFNKTMPVTFYQRNNWLENLKKSIAELEVKVMTGKLSQNQARYKFSEIEARKPKFKEKSIESLIQGIDLSKIAREYSEA